MRSPLVQLSLLCLAHAACPYMDGSNAGAVAHDHQNEIQDFQDDADFWKQFTLDDSNGFITSDAGGPIQENTSLKAGQRGPTLLEDFIFRQKIQHFDHERVCCLCLCVWGMCY